MAELTVEMFNQVQQATFAIVGADGVTPICCGFFVSECGVALTAAHDAEKWLRKPTRKGGKMTARAATYNNQRFLLEVVMPQIGELDIAVLRRSHAAALPWLPLPTAPFTAQELSGAAVTLIHGSIAWSEGTSATNFAEESGNIITSNATTIHYNISSYKGHSGAALLLRGEQVIGLHSDGFNDLPDEESERRADAVRLDLPAVRTAVAKFLKPKAA